MPVVHVWHYNHAVCPWSWGREPGLRRLAATRLESLRFNYVMCGVAREVSELWSAV